MTLSRTAWRSCTSCSRNGGTPRRLTISNGIDTEAVLRARRPFIYFVSDRGGGPQIYRVGAGGGNAERITFVGDYNISPAISPDGKTLAYITQQGDAFKLMTQDLASGAVQTLTDTADDESPSFAPNGRLLVYATRLQGRDVLMTTTLDGKIKTRLLTTTWRHARAGLGPVRPLTMAHRHPVTRPAPVAARGLPAISFHRWRT